MSPYDTLKHLTKHYPEILGERGVTYLLLLRGKVAAGRVARLAQAAVAERSDYHASGEKEDWLEDSQVLYTELLAVAKRLGSLHESRCAYYQSLFEQEQTAAGRLRMLCLLHTKNERHTQELAKTIENYDVLTRALTRGQDPAAAA